MLHRPLGQSGIEVSALSLGSWRTYERIPREQGVAVLDQARACGIDFLEVARYNDETGAAPIPTGYSEVVFGEVFRASSYVREEVVIAGKLWWEFWPRQSAVDELEASLRRTGLDRLDVLYADPPPDDLPLEDVVGAITGLIADGRIRAWGIVNWPAERIAEAGRIARESGVAPPCAAQLAYSLAYRDPVEAADTVAALELCGASVIASYTLAGGLLTGKYARPGATGRMASEAGAERWRGALEIADRLVELAGELDGSPAALAIAFALANPGVASVLFGATAPGQVAENAAAVALLETLDAPRLAALRALGD